MFLNFSAAHSPVRLDIETKFRYFLFLTWLSKIRNFDFFMILASPFNPLGSHDALKHHFTSPKTDLIFLAPRLLEQKFP